MIDIHITGDGEPEALADLIASTLYGHIVPDPQSDLAAIGKLVREQQERFEEKRIPRGQVETVDFAKLDADLDWSDL